MEPCLTSFFRPPPYLLRRTNGKRHQDRSAVSSMASVIIPQAAGETSAKPPFRSPVSAPIRRRDFTEAFSFSKENNLLRRGQSVVIPAAITAGGYIKPC